MELGTIEEVELIVDQIASNKIPPPNKAQSLVIIRQMVRMAKQVEAQAKEIAELRANAGEFRSVYLERGEELAKLKALCDEMGAALEQAMAEEMKRYSNTLIYGTSHPEMFFGKSFASMPEYRAEQEEANRRAHAVLERMLGTNNQQGRK